MYSNCVIFISPDKQELRVVFDPDGAAFFCGTDLAVLAGYSSPAKAVNSGNQGTNRIESVLRKVPWDNGMKRGSCKRNCFSADNSVKFLCKRPAPFAVIRWFQDEVIPKSEEIGEKVAREYVSWEKKSTKTKKIETYQETVTEVVTEPFKESTRNYPSLQAEDIKSRLDNIILECALLKRDLLQMQ